MANKDTDRLRGYPGALQSKEKTVKKDFKCLSANRTKWSYSGENEKSYDFKNG